MREQDDKRTFQVRDPEEDSGILATGGSLLGAHSHEHGGHSHGDGLHSHGGHSHREAVPGHGVPVQSGFVPAARPGGTERAPLSEGDGKGKTLYFDMQSGIAGDMSIASLLDLGVPEVVVTRAIETLELGEVKLVVRSGYAGAIGCTHFDVQFEAQGRERSYPEIAMLIQGSTLSSEVKELSLKIFLRLARAEAAVHRTTLENVHFHEVGAVDAIVDIVGFSAALTFLGARVCASPVPLGRGFVECRHGRLPLPAPATLGCLEGVPTVSSGLEAELVTPTGAAIVATVAEEFCDWPAMVPERIGWGAGTVGLPDRPNALRVVLGEARSLGSELTHALLEANVDDMTGEVAAHALNQILAAGAVDVWITPVLMKKGRPGMIFSALCRQKDASRVTDALLLETSSIGVRQTLVSRTEQDRHIREVDTPWGPVRVKVSGAGTSQEKCKPEVEDCLAIAKREGLPLRVVIDQVAALAQAAARAQLEGRVSR